MNFMLYTMLDATDVVLRVHYKSMKCDVLFSQGTVRTIFRWGGHFSYMIKKFLPLYNSAKIIKIDRCNSLSGQRFFTNRVINLWNNLPGKTTDFTSLRKFCASINNNYFTKFCTVNYGWSYCVLLFIQFSVFFIVSYFTTMCYVLSTCKRLISPLLYNKFDLILIEIFHSYDK